MAAGLELHQNLAVVGADGRVVAERQTVLLGNDPEVVQDEVDFIPRNGPADFLLDGAEDLLGGLDAGARGRAHVQAELAGVHGGEEIPPHPRQGDKRAADDQREGKEDGRTI